jgi:hypothetical protein
VLPSTLAGAFVVLPGHCAAIVHGAMPPFSSEARPGTVLFKALIPDDHSE